MQNVPSLRFEDLPDFLTINELKLYLRIGTNKAYELANSPGIPHLKAGNKKIFPKHQLREWLNNEIERGRLPRRLQAVK